MLFVFSFWFFRSPIKSWMTGVWPSLPGCLVVIAGLTGNLLSKVVYYFWRCVKVVAED
jgi:hypothetical protein